MAIRNQNDSQKCKYNALNFLVDTNGVQDEGTGLAFRPFSLYS